MLTLEEEQIGFEVIDGYVVDPFGEVIRLAQKPPFVPDSRASVDWVLMRMGEAEGEIVAIAHRRASILANLAKLEKRAAAKLKWLHSRFDAEVAAFAKKELAGTKSKTLQLDHGSISFRMTKGTNRITDQPRAVAFMRASGYASVVKVEESVTATNVVNAIQQLAATLPEPPDTSAFLESTPGDNKVTITANVLEG